MSRYQRTFGVGVRRLLITIFGFLSVFLTVFLTVMAAGGPAAAGTINVLGFVDLDSAGRSTVNLGGDRGFTLNGGGQFFNVGPSNECFSSSTTCVPGTTFSLHANSIGNDLFGRATLDGVSIPTVSGDCPSGPPGNKAPCGNAGFEFSGQAVVPPFGDFTLAIVKAPVDFSGLFDVEIPDGGGSQNTLVASAIATLTLRQTTDFSNGSLAWRYDGIRYELAPTPEPTTLLLFGTAMAGLGLARWRRRGRQHAA